MARVLRSMRAALAGVALSASAAAAACPPASAIADYVFGGGLCLAVATFGAEAAGTAPILVVVVHGDISDGGAATYHAAFAETLARPGVVVVALVRPGYSDAGGRVSEGSTLGRHDNYTSANVAAVASAIAALQTHYRARRTVYVGHSGGAAIGGVLIGRRPGLIAAAVLVSCPCDIAHWRHLHGAKPWTRSLSPDFFIPRVPRSTEVIAITGTADGNTFPALAEDYVARLSERGILARFVPIAGAGHGFSGVSKATREAVEDIIAR